MADLIREAGLYSQAAWELGEAMCYAPADVRPLIYKTALAHDVEITRLETLARLVDRLGLV